MFFSFALKYNMPLENFKKIRKKGEWIAKYGTDLGRLFYSVVGEGVEEKQRKTTTTKKVTIMMMSNTTLILKMDISDKTPQFTHK